MEYEFSCLFRNTTFKFWQSIVSLKMFMDLLNNLGNWSPISKFSDECRHFIIH